MVAALREAERDAGGNLLAGLHSLAIVDQISFGELGNLCAPLAAAIGASPPVNYQSPAPYGDTPIRMLNEAANRIGAGEIALAAVVGGEALRTAAGRMARRASDSGAPFNAPFNAMRAAFTAREPTYAQRHGLTAPVDVYPLYENATRAAWGQSLAEAQGESAEIWSRFSAVAAGNDGAWLRQPLSPADILEAGAGNRPLAFPYTKLMVANSSVNQSAGFIVASLAEARRRGIPEGRMIHVGMGAAAKEPADVLRRDRFDHSVSMETAICQTLALNGMSRADCDFVELYSCFPCVPKMARRILDWPLDQPASVFGGLTFGGGPIANYMSHAVAAMVEKLRAGARRGFLFANGGLATDNHCIVLANQPFDQPLERATFPQDFDYQAEADAARGAIPPLEEDYCGAASVESYTVFYDRAGEATAGVVVARGAAGQRTLARVDVGDADLLSLLTGGAIEPVGAKGRIVDREAAGRFWQL